MIFHVCPFKEPGSMGKAVERMPTERGNYGKD
jgi:hypothetical protein